MPVRRRLGTPKRNIGSRSRAGPGVKANLRQTKGLGRRKTRKVPRARGSGSGSKGGIR